jgi:hypothetical protein
MVRWQSILFVCRKMRTRDICSDFPERYRYTDPNFLPQIATGDETVLSSRVQKINVWEIQVFETERRVNGNLYGQLKCRDAILYIKASVRYEIRSPSTEFIKHSAFKFCNVYGIKMKSQNESFI